MPSLPRVVRTTGQHHELSGIDDWINVLQSLQLPFALFPLLHFTSSRAIMGDFASSRITTALGWILALVIISVNSYLIVITFQDSGGEWYLTFVACLVMVPYFVFSLYLAVGPVMKSSVLHRIYRPDPDALRGGEELAPLALHAADDAHSSDED